GGGAVAGALLFTPSLSGAQETTTTAAPTPAPAPPDGPMALGRGGRLRLGFGEPSLAAAAKAIGIREADLRTALRSGKSIADVAKDHGVAVDKVVDALVAEATSRIDQAVKDGKLDDAEATELKADLKDHITAIVNGERPHFGGFRGGPGFDDHDG